MKTLRAKNSFVNEIKTFVVIYQRLVLLVIILQLHFSLFLKT